ncbi:MAG: arsenate reductase ArsC [Holophagales bacterium]|nr:arsenate reductase ArsC [Holophagales bacterium]
MSQSKPSILVLCTGNSARSQMARAYLDRELEGEVRVYSAGTSPAEHIHPLTVKVLEEDGFDLAGQRPVSYEEYLGRIPVQTLVIVCGGADKACPSVWPGVLERLFWPFEDPAAFEGSDEEKVTKFRAVRDAIRAQAEAYARDRSSQPPAGAPAAGAPAAGASA